MNDSELTAIETRAADMTSPTESCLIDIPALIAAYKEEHSAFVRYFNNYQMEQHRANALVARVRELEAIVTTIPQIIRDSGKPGPGGINLTGGVDSVVFVGIGRERYADEYEVAEAAAHAAREAAASIVEMKLAALAAKVGE